MKPVWKLRIIVLGVLAWPSCPAIVQAQRDQALMDLYRLEQENWKECVDASGAFTTTSNFDVRFYHLQIEPRIASPYIQGNVLCRFTAVEAGTSTIRLTLRREYTVDSMRGTINGFTIADDTITVSLDRAFASGDTGWVQVYYRGIPPLANNTKGLRYVTHAGGQRVIASLSTPFLSHYWWPCKEGPGDKADSVYVDITIPDTSVGGIPMIAISNGTLTGVDSVAGKKTFRWRERYPIVPYYVMIAVSNYRDFHQAFTGSHGEQFPLDYYVFDEHLTAAQQGVADLPQVMAAFSERFGTYPFPTEKYGMTQLGFYGAIENQTNTITNNMGSSWFGVSVHELAHMWFGDMITCLDWHHGWLNEGFATYAEALWAEHAGGFAVYQSYMQNFQFMGGGTLYLENISDPFNIFVPIIYDKGAYVLHMLRGVLGGPVFFDCLSAYAGSPAHRYGHATTEDFKSICEAVSGRDLGFFFTEWVYDQYYPMYGYGFTQNTATGETSVLIRQTQSALGRRPVFTMPVQLKFLFPGGDDTTVTVWNDQQVQTFPFSFSQTIASMEFDPDMWILKSAQAVSVDEEPAPSHPAAFALEQNYPNPFNGDTKIGYRIQNTAERRWVTLKVYDVLGREVARLVNEPGEPGVYSVQWDASGAGSGVYFCRMVAGRYHAVRTMLVLK